MLELLRDAWRTGEPGTAKTLLDRHSAALTEAVKELGKIMSDPRSSKEQTDAGHAKVDLEDRKLRLL